MEDFDRNNCVILRYVSFTEDFDFLMQPFNSSLYSVGVIYTVICNLPYIERYKSHNILTLAVISGPKELKLHKINNYLYPIINQLVHLWSDYNIVTHENK